MLKFLFFVGVCACVYFCGVGFLRTAEKVGWSESGAVSHGTAYTSVPK